MTYNYSAFNTKDYDLVNFRGPAPGSPAPDFTLDLVGGGQAQLLDFEDDFLVLEMGSITCPLFQGRRKAMTRLDRTIPDVAFAILYVREAHPGASIPAHTSSEDKTACATRLVKNEGESRRVFVDDIDGTAHSAYGGYPNSVFIINRNGCVVYACDWNNPTATARALEQLKSGQPAQVRSYFKPVPPQVSLRVLGNGGKGSMSDFFYGLPNLIWNNLILRNLRLWRGKPVQIAPDARC